MQWGSSFWTVILPPRKLWMDFDTKIFGGKIGAFLHKKEINIKTAPPIVNIKTALLNDIGNLPQTWQEIGLSTLFFWQSFGFLHSSERVKFVIYFQLNTQTVLQHHLNCFTNKK